ncbi:MAG TPA: serine protease [Candidatus Acidoferrales bacterium]|nr:serine protease [Candidatus Acidoferrales bacterium]
MKWLIVVLVLFPIAAWGQAPADGTTNRTVKADSVRESPRGGRTESALTIASAGRTVVPITKLHNYGLFGSIQFGSGFCLDPECRFIVTNYHVARAMGKRFSIQHEPVVERWLASGPNDEGATKQGYNPLHDLAVAELKRSLNRIGFHGLPYNMEDVRDLVVGQDVNIYAFPLELNPKRKLQQFRGEYIGLNHDGLLAFSYEPNPQVLRAGVSGGLVVDENGRVMAVLNEIVVNRKDVVLGVPVEVLSAFVSKIQPYLAARLFPETAFIPPVEPDIYPEWVPHRPDGGLERRPVEPPDVQLLRLKAQDVVDGMRAVLSVESFEWGKGSAANDPQAIGYYEVRTFDGYQHFRTYPDGKKEMAEVPWPPLNCVIEPGGAWSYMAKLVAKEYDLRIRRAPDIVWKGQTLRVFQYHGAKEDKVCTFDDQIDFFLMVHHHLESYNCSGEAWTDQSENIMRVSENYYMEGARTNVRMIVTFGWTDIDGNRLLVPITISMETEDGSHINWCRGQFTDYRQFRATVRLLVPPPTSK